MSAVRSNVLDRTPFGPLIFSQTTSNLISSPSIRKRGLTLALVRRFASRVAYMSEVTVSPYNQRPSAAWYKALATPSR